MPINSIKEKEKRVMKLLEEGRTFKEIAKDEHVSFSYISMVIKLSVKVLSHDHFSYYKSLSFPRSKVYLMTPQL